MKQITMTVMSVILVLVFQILGIFAESSEKDNSEVYLTNSSSAYNNIPQTCKLYGSDFSGELDENFTINITHEGSFWIRAGIGFRRHLNPIGAMYSCAENYNRGITLDQCTSICTTKYISHNSKSCHCVESKTTDESLATVKPCGDDLYGLCYTGGCVVYEKDVTSERLLCGTYKFQHIWVYATEECETELPYICENGDANNRSYSWFLAHHYCKQQNSNLLQENSGILHSYKDGRKYWISPFRRQVFLWQYDTIESLCVAGNVTDDGTLIPFIDFCNRTLPALCFIQNYEKTELKHAQHASVKGVVIGIVCACVAIVVVIVVVVIVNRRRNKVFRNITESDILNATEIEPLEQKLDTISLPELSATYSDPIPASFYPIDTAMKGLTNPEPLYESTTNVNCIITTSNSDVVTYSDPINTCAIKT